MYAGYKEEGDLCNNDGCRGTLGYAHVENCSCHISAPCSQCVNNPLTCQDCDTIKWPEPNMENLRAAIYDAREQGLLPDGDIFFPDGTLIQA